MSFQDKELTLQESETTSRPNSALSTKLGSLPRASQVLHPAPAPPRCFCMFKGRWTMLWEVGTSAVHISEGARQPYYQAGPNLWLYTTRLDDPKYSLHSTKDKPNVPSLKGSPTPPTVPFLETFLRLHTNTPGTGVQPAAPTPRAHCCHRGRPSLLPGWCSRILLAQCSTRQVRFIDPARNELCRKK